MPKKEGKGVVLPIDWDTSRPNDRPSNISAAKARPFARLHDAHPLLSTFPMMQGETRLPLSHRHDSASSEVRGQRVAPANMPALRQGQKPWAPDIYAHTFVPDCFTGINRSAATLIVTPGVDSQDIPTYIASFAGSIFLTPRAKPEYLRGGPSDHDFSPRQLALHNYGAYFKDCLSLDLEARLPEVRSYDLFGVNLGSLDNVTYSLHVPGLKEGTPLVCFGDSLMLRQLVLHPRNNLPLGMDSWLAPGGGLHRAEVAPGFTGLQISAVVIGVDKTKDILYLRANGLQMSGRIMCNVSFVMQPRLIESLQRAIEDVGVEMKTQYTDLITARPSVENSNLSANKRPDVSFHASKTTSPSSGVAALPAVGFTDMSRQDSEPVHSSVRHTWLQRVLFPENQYGVLQTKLPSGKFSQDWYDKELNYEQKVRERSLCRQHTY